MRNTFFALILAFAANVGTILADVAKIGDLYYYFEDANQTAIVTYQQYELNNYSGLTTVTIPAFVEYNSVTYRVTVIGESAFYNCNSLTSITIPNSVTIIEQSAFRNCSGLLSIDLPNSLTTIGECAFVNCSSLTSVEIPNSVVNIEWCAFSLCSSLTHPVYNAYVFAYMPVSYADAYVIPDGIESITGGAFSYCTGLKSIEIPNSVTNIGKEAFCGCSSLKSATIGNGVTKIGNNAFSYCTDLTHIISKAITPPLCGDCTAFYDVNKEIPLYVPNESVQVYKTANDWKDFHNILPLSSMDIENVNATSRDGFVKYLSNGHVFIQCGEKMYMVTGVEVK